MKDSSFKTNEVFEKLNQLTDFVDFLMKQPFATEEQKEKAPEINYLISNLANPSTHKYFSIALDMFDYDSKTSFAWRTWSIYQELNCFTVSAESHFDEKLKLEDNDFYFEAFVYFTKEGNIERAFFNKQVSQFLEDVKAYNKYVSATTEKIEIEIDLKQ